MNYPTDRLTNALARHYLHTPTGCLMHATARNATRAFMLVLGLAASGATATALAQDPKIDPRPAPARAEGEGPFDRLTIRNATLIDGTGRHPLLRHLRGALRRP